MIVSMMEKHMNTEQRGSVMYIPWDKNKGSLMTIARILATKVKQWTVGRFKASLFYGNS